MNTVSHISINTDNPLDSSSDRFLNITVLTLTGSHFQYSDSSLTNLGKMIPLIQLRTLNINTDYCHFNPLVNLLQFTCNLRILSLNCILTGAANINSLKNNKTFRLLVLSRNKIEWLCLTRGCTLNMIKLFTHLCTKLKHLTIGELLDPFESIIQFLLLGTIENNYQLFRIIFSGLSTVRIKQLQRFIQSREILRNHAVKVIHRDTYVWR